LERLAAVIRRFFIAIVMPMSMLELIYRAWAAAFDDD
jgi:hypothetical protein